MRDTDEIALAILRLGMGLIKVGTVRKWVLLNLLLFSLDQTTDERLSKKG